MKCWLALVPVLSSACSSLQCDAALSPIIDRTMVGVGLVGQPMSITIWEHYCRSDAPGGEPVFELFGPGDVPVPVTAHASSDVFQSTTMVRFTPPVSGRYYLKGVPPAQAGVVQLFLSVAVDRRDAARTSRVMPASCFEGASFGRRGVLCTGSASDPPFLSVGDAQRLALPESARVVADVESAWVLDLASAQLTRYVEGASGGLSPTGSLSLADAGSSLGTISRAPGGRVLSSLGELQLVAAGSDGGLQVERRLGPHVPLACLRGDTLLTWLPGQVVETTELSTGRRVTLPGTYGLIGCTGESMWLSNTGTTRAIGILLPGAPDGGEPRVASLPLGSDLNLQAHGEVPFVGAVVSERTSLGSVDGPVFPALRGDQLELEYYGPGDGLWASEHTVLLRDDGGTWLVTRP